MRFKLSLVSALVVASLSGCTSIIPKSIPKGLTPSEAASRVQDRLAEWSHLDTPPVVLSGESFVTLINQQELPESLKKRPLEVKMDSPLTASDMVMLLNGVDIPAMSIAGGAQPAGGSTEAGSSPAASSGNGTFYLPKYKGTLGQFLGAASRALNVFFLYEKDFVVATPTAEFSVAIPQDAALAKAIADGVKELGAASVAAQPTAGLVVMKLTPRQVESVRDLVQRLAQNAATVSMKVAVINTQMSRESTVGIDWASLALAAGRGTDTLLTNGSGSTGTTPVTPTTGTGATTPTTGTGTAAATPESFTYGLLSLAGGKGTLKFLSEGFSFSGLVNFLETYGNTQTIQNTMLSTITGSEVELQSVTQIPYVSSVGVTNAAQSNVLMGSANTATANDGVTLKLKPTYDSASNTVTVDLKLAIESVLGFNNLNAGNQIGQVTQPTTASRKFNDVLRMRPGEVAIVGGVAFDSMEDSRSGLTPLQDEPVSSKKGATRRNQMFIIVRPTVTVYGYELPVGDAPAGILAPRPELEPRRGSGSSPAKAAEPKPPVTRTATPEGANVFMPAHED